jgi:hypothetical protein
MKKYLVAQLIFLVPFLSNAQDLVIKGTKQIEKKYTPQQVIDSLAVKFPDARSVKYFKADGEAAQRGWAVTTEDNLQSGAVDYYTISFKQKGLQYYGLYDPNGQLLECKIEQKEAELPAAVVTNLKAIAKDYPGYKVVSKTYYKTQNYSKSKEHYEITAKNGDKTKYFYYSPTGELLKVKD